MDLNLIACQQFAFVSHPQPATAHDAWQLVAAFEAAAILILLIGWLSKTDGGHE